jgi:hypothetical protein
MRLRSNIESLRRERGGAAGATEGAEIVRVV